MKKCNGSCNKEKEDTEFHVKRYKTGVVGLRAYCKECSSLKRIEYRKSSPKDNNRNKAYNKKYALRLRARKLQRYWPGLTWREALERWDEFFVSQAGQCAMCPKTLNLHVDHDHKTGKVRGLLCNTCNRGLGMLNDDANLLSKGIIYLKNTS